MYTKNKLGIYVYDTDILHINNVSWEVNSISHTILTSNRKTKFRYINNQLYGILITNKKYIKNKLGIYVYDKDTFWINNIYYNVNSISHDNLRKFRMINTQYYGIRLKQTYMIYDL